MCDTHDDVTFINKKSKKTMRLGFFPLSTTMASGGGMNETNMISLSLSLSLSTRKTKYKMIMMMMDTIGRNHTQHITEASFYDSWAR